MVKKFLYILCCVFMVSSCGTGRNTVPEFETASGGRYGWYELPVMNIKEKGGYLVDADDPDLYFAYHLCAGNEKGPGGKKARNYTVCYSAEHHCPVWVAAPLHDVYEGRASRTEAYAPDPAIPASAGHAACRS